MDDLALLELDTARFAESLHGAELDLEAVTQRIRKLRDLQENARRELLQAYKARR